MEKLNDIFDLYDRSLAFAGMKGKEFIHKNGRNINHVLHLFSDEESRYLYAQEIVYCSLLQILDQEIIPSFIGLMTGKEFSNYVSMMRESKLFDILVAPDTEDADFYKAIDMTVTFLLEQYRYKDIVHVEEGDICIDGGAFIGDTALYFAEKKAKKIYSFEVDHKNLECLKTNIKNFQKQKIIDVIEKALGSRCETMSYVPMRGNISAGQVVENAEGKDGYDVEVTTIDVFCEEQKIIPNFIKMDIEGSEFDALNGAKKTIQSYHPKLAICIYHTYEHHWNIPLLIYEYYPEYRFYLKKSQPYGETVLFAIA